MRRCLCIRALWAVLGLGSAVVAGEGVGPVLQDKGAEGELARAKNGLALSVRTDKAHYEPHETIDLRATLRNVTGLRPGDKGRDIPVHVDVLAQTPKGRLAEWLLTLEVRDDETKEVVYRSPELRVPDIDRRKYHHVITLPPRVFVGWTFKFPPMVFTPGRRYAILASYVVGDAYPHIIRHRDFTVEHVKLLGVKLAYHRIWTGRLVSNRAVVRIRPRPR